MRSIMRVTSLLVALLCGTQLSNGQYYSWGADRASLRWSKIEGDRASLIFPDSVEQTARRTLHYIDAVKGDIYYDFKYQPLDIPFVFHADNFNSNGMVMWAPLRVEFLTSPAINSYSMPWVKQLVSHEYRHAVQYNNLDRSTLKIFNYILGQQGAAVSLLFPPLYALEGDAVLCETQMSTFGRGLQPSFLMGYRALSDELMNQSDYLKWRCGSYRTSIPDHYAMGYQLLSYAYSKYNENILDKTFEYIARNPQFISPYSIALRKYYDTSTKELLYESFDSLVKLWDSLPEVEPTSTIISQVDKKNYTTYSYPIVLDSGELLALKSDYEDPSRFVLFDPATVTERRVAYSGVVSTAPAYAAGRVWWTEYRRSPLFEEDVNSQLCYMDLEEGKPKWLKGHSNALYATPIDQSAEHIAYVEYLPSGQYSVVEIIDGEKVSSIDIKYPNEVHSMAWDNRTQALYIIVTGDKGMWIERQVGDRFEPLTKAAYVTISNLKARDGKLYFGSIASGRDEIHSLDIATGLECQLSESKYGSFQAAAGDDNLYMTTYDKYGYHLAAQSAESAVKEVEYSNVPINLVNPEPVKWDVINLDSVTFSEADLSHSHQEYESCRYCKGANLFNIHSWAPLRYDPFNILDEQTLDIGLGATVASQNLLSSCESYLSYGWDKSEGSILKTGIYYDGLGVNLNLSATYGGAQNLYLSYLMEDLDDISLKKYVGVNLSASLPLYFSRGYHTRVITPYVGWGYSNGIVPHGDLSWGVESFSSSSDDSDDSEGGITVAKPSIDSGSVSVESTKYVLNYNELKRGLNKFSVGVSYASYVQSAVRDLTVPKGYALSAALAMDPTNSDFSKLISLYGKLYTPGLAQNNSFTVAAAYQNAIGGFEIEGFYPLSYISTALLPTGFAYYDISNNDYFAASANYKFPLCYPELSAVWNALYLKRMSLGLGVDYAQFESYTYQNSSIYSYGVDLILDLNVISMTSASTSSVTLSLYKPQGKSLYFQFSLGLPIN